MLIPKNYIKTHIISGLSKPKVVTPVRIPITKDASVNLSGSKKKYSSVKSTIPRPSSKKE